EGQTRMEELHRRIDEFLGEENRLLAERNRELERRRAAGRAFLLIAVALGLIGAVLAEWLFSSGISRRLRNLEKNARLLANGMPLVAGSLGRDEMGSLDRELHAAARIITEREARLRESIADRK